MSNIYFIKPTGMDGPIKIGFSKSPSTRLINLSAWSPFRLELIGSVPGAPADESFLHNCFADLHSHREWFRVEPRLLRAIKTVLSAGTVGVLRGVIVPKGNIRSRARNFSQQRSLYLSYSARIRWQRQKLRDADENGAWHEPLDVDAIMKKWDRFRRMASDDEIARLDEFLKDPGSQSIIPPWRRAAA